MSVIQEKGIDIQSINKCFSLQEKISFSDNYPKKKRYAVKAGAFIWVVIALFLCNLSFASEESLLSKIQDLEAALERVEENIINLKCESYRHKSLLSILKETYVPKIVLLNFRENERFEMINTSVGNFFILGKEAIPYLDGYKIVLKIGNPYYADFCSPKLVVRWNIPHSNQKSKEKEFSLSKEIPAGKWTLLEVILTPCRLEELEEVIVELDFDSVQLCS